MRVILISLWARRRVSGIKGKSMRNQRSIPHEDPGPLWERLFDLDEIEALLQGSARAGLPISYADMLDSLGYAFSRPKMRALCVALGEVDRRAKKKKQPELAVLVVRASDKIPGQGWWVNREDENYKGPWEGPKAEKYIKAIQQKAFTYWKDR